MKEDRNEYLGYLPVCPITPEHPEMLIGIPAEYEAKVAKARENASEYALNTETWD
ncbi:MAG: hypothetical protein K6B74_09355 [Ruminococcus sp.]|nr:hypothetical protein [Ruminococcus sp.]